LSGNSLRGGAFSTADGFAQLQPQPLNWIVVRILEKEGTCMAYPASYRYTREHEWIAVDGNIGTVGITDYAQNSLGDIVYVDMPKVGDSISANATFGSVESVKAVSDLYSPVSGTVTEMNETLKTEPDKINSAPHDTWIIKIELSNPGELNSLLDAAAYEAFISEETGS